MLNYKLDLQKNFKIPEKFLSFERRMKEREDKYLGTVHIIKSYNDLIAKYSKNIDLSLKEEKGSVAAASNCMQKSGSVYTYVLSVRILVKIY